MIKTDKRNKQVLLVFLVLMLATLGFLLWYLKNMNLGSIFNPVEPGRILPYPNEGKAPAEDSGLGGEIYGKTSNPIKNNLPGDVAPNPNPLEGVYNNPFE